MQLLSHGLRAGEVSALDIKDYDGRRLHILGAKWGSDGKVPLKPEAVTALDSYLGWMVRQGIGAFCITPRNVAIQIETAETRIE